MEKKACKHINSYKHSDDTRYYCPDCGKWLLEVEATPPKEQDPEGDHVGNLVWKDGDLRFEPLSQVQPFKKLSMYDESIQTIASDSTILKEQPVKPEIKPGTWWSEGKRVGQPPLPDASDGENAIVEDIFNRHINCRAITPEAVFNALREALQVPHSPQPKSLEECKDIIAKKYGAINWRQLDLNSIGTTILVNNVAELYAQQAGREWISGNAPKDRLIIRWHIAWKCPIAVFYKDGHWYEKTLTTYWPEYAFTGHFMNLPEPPKEEI